MSRFARSTIAGLMGVVLVVALGLAALRSGSYAWSGVMFLFTSGVLSLAAVGAVCGPRSGRAWWLGFAAFGWGYLTLIFEPDFYITAPYSPTDDWLRLAQPYIGPAPPWRPGFHGLADDCYRQVGHCLISLMTAAIGGMLAHAFFGASSARANPPGEPPRPADPMTARRLRWPAIAGLTALVLFAAVAFTGAVRAPGRWAGVTVLLTWACLELGAVAGVCGRGRKRAGYLGATVFGAGYMVLAFSQPAYHLTWPRIATDEFLNAVRPWLPPVTDEFPADSDAIAIANARILKALDKKIPMRFPDETPLEDALKTIAAATQTLDGRRITIYIDPTGLLEAEKTERSPVTLVMEGVPLRTTLNLLLRQIGLEYRVKDGVLEVVSTVDLHDDYIPACEDPYLTIGQCVLALFATGVGGVLSTLIHDRDAKAP